mmetsp:Transcript_16174/g.30703  ORF Transcript_16174/g.30703 Transcript_16174/m.30703 type:complete len:87 (-) Transcript_16174:545-805(-)
MKAPPITKAPIGPPNHIQNSEPSPAFVAGRLEMIDSITDAKNSTIVPTTKETKAPRHADPSAVLSLLLNELWMTSRAPATTPTRAK